MPNRILKESIRTSKTLNTISDFQFRLWAYLITYVDDYGRGSADPEIIRGMVLTRRKGVTDKAILDALHGLENNGLIRLYDVEGNSYLCFPNWDKHQQIRSKKSKFPAPDSSCNQMIADDCKCPRNPIQSESNPNPNPNEYAPPVGGAPAREASRAFGHFGWVKLTQAEHERLVQDLGPEETKRCIAYVDESAQATGNKNRWKDWNLVVRKCHRDGWGLRRGGRTPVRTDADYSGGESMV